VEHLSDQFLLQDYRENRSEAAFAELVRRYVDLIYSAAKRLVRDEHLASDVTQSVFVALARDAGKLDRRPVLAGWLHCTCRNLAANVVRADVRRRAREHQAALMNEISSAGGDDSWEQITPALDAALAGLSSDDHNAVLVRYFQNKTVAELAEVLRISESAAQKRVNRAVERLRRNLTRQGVGVVGAGMAAAISAYAIETAPAGLAAASATSALQVVSQITVANVAGVWMKIAMTTASAAVVGLGLYVFHLRGEIESLRRERAGLVAQLEKLGNDRDEALRQAAALAAEAKQRDRGNHELARLRAELARLRDPRDVPAVNDAPQTETPEKPSQVQVTLETSMFAASEDELLGLHIQWLSDPDGGAHGVLTGVEFNQLTKALKNLGPLVSSMKVTSLSGRQTRLISSVSLAEVQPPADPVDEAMKAAIAAASEINGRVTLAMQALYYTNGQNFNLTLVGELRQKVDRVAEARAKVEGTYVEPAPQVQSSNNVTLLRDQAVVVERDIPARAWPTDYKGSPPAKKLVILVTPTAIDAAGNRLVKE
jgi:RNA polymerase sigma factor (sigma-70 family)